MGVLNPDPVRYYYKAFGRFSWAKLPVDLSADEYFSVLAHGPAKVLRMQSCITLILSCGCLRPESGESGEKGIWGYVCWDFAMRKTDGIVCLS